MEYKFGIMFRKQSSKAASVVSATPYFWARLALGAALREPDAHQAPLICHPPLGLRLLLSLFGRNKKKEKKGKKKTRKSEKSLKWQVRHLARDPESNKMCSLGQKKKTNERQENIFQLL